MTPKGNHRLVGGRAVWLAIGMALWLAAVSWGFVLACRFELTPGSSGAAAARWPAASRLQPADSKRFVLVLAMHPRCPCSRASIGELAQIAAACPGLVDIQALIYSPDNGEHWDSHELVKELEAISGVHCIEDVGGAEARRFGAITSGHVCLYGPKGQLLFSGGITGGRGVEGNNRGREAVAERVRGGVTEPISLEVYGCPLYELPPS